MLLDALWAGRASAEVGGERLYGDELAGAAAAVARRVAGASRVAVVATPSLQTIVAVAGSLAAGAAVVPLNPASGDAERAHVLRDALPDLVLGGPGGEPVELAARGTPPEEAVAGPETPAFIVYTSGTTGPPKGAVIPRRAVAADLDALAEAWAWNDADTLVHALPLFHVHGLILGTLGPLRIGSPLVHTGRFGPHAGGTVYFAVPTMWRRLDDASLRELATARLLVSGSAALPAPVFDRVAAAAGHRIAERYGLTETLILTAARHDGDRRAGCVGPSLPGVEMRIADADADGLGEIAVRGPTLFSGYLGNPAATDASYDANGWFRTGDLGRIGDGGLTLLGRKATDLISSGGYKIGAGEVEGALLAHPAVAEAAVLGLPDDDLGERVVAWVVAAEPVEAGALADHVAASTAPHKRPREVRFVDTLPRNEMGKVQKIRLRDGPSTS